MTIRIVQMLRLHLLSIDAESVTAIRTGDFTREESFIEHHLSVSRGQVTPVSVRRRTVEGGRPYELIGGFRTYAALMLEAHRYSDDPNRLNQIWAIEYELDGPFDAVILQLIQNKEPEILSSDKVAALRMAAALMPGDMTDQKMADTLGMSRAHHYRLMRIARKIDPDLLKTWQEDATPLSFDDIEGVVLGHNTVSQYHSVKLEDEQIGVQSIDKPSDEFADELNEIKESLEDNLSAVQALMDRMRIAAEMKNEG